MVRFGPVGEEGQTIMKRVIALGVLAVSMITHSVPGQQQTDETVPLPPPSLEWRFELLPGVWFPRLGGEVRLGDSPRAVSLHVKRDLDLRDAEVVFDPDVTIRLGDTWHLRAGGFAFSTDAAGVFEGEADFGRLTLRDGDRYRGSVDIDSAAIEVGAALWTWVDWQSPDEAGRRTAFTLAPKLGLRYVQVEQDLELIGTGREDVGGEWTALYGGLEMRLRWERPDVLPIGRAFELNAAGGLGPAFGADGGFIWQVRANATLDLTANLGVTIGYRLLELDVEDGPYDCQAGLQGLFVGATLRF